MSIRYPRHAPISIPPFPPFLKSSMAKSFTFTKHVMPLSVLPNELLLDIADRLSVSKDLFALTQTCKHFNLLFTPHLCAPSLQPQNATTPALTWFSKHGYSKQVSCCLSAAQSHLPLW